MFEGPDLPTGDNYGGKRPPTGNAVWIEAGTVEASTETRTAPGYCARQTAAAA